MTYTTLRVRRGAPDRDQWIQEYVVPYTAGMTVLDAVLWVRQHVDPSLVVRYSCRANACKECSAVINGKTGYLCTTKAPENGAVDIASLSKRRWIRDLVAVLD